MSGEYREIVEGREFDVLESFAGNYAEGRSNYMHDGYAYTEFIFSMADLIVEL